MKLFVLLLLVSSLAAVEPGSFEEKSSSYSWKCQEIQGLPNVLILGDSISIGYTLQVRQYLKNIANVHRPITPEGGPENCGPSSKSRERLAAWLAGKKWDIVHFNAGLHDLKRVAKSGKSTAQTPVATPLEDYRQNLQAIVSLLKKHCKKIIFASTTAYPQGVTPLRLPKDAKIYNDIATEVMIKNQIPINDLYALTVDRLAEMQMPKNVHFKEKGSAILGKQVASVIARELKLGSLKIPPYDTASEAQKAARELLSKKKYNDAEQALLFAAALSTNTISKARCISQISSIYINDEEWDRACQLLKQVKAPTHNHPFGNVIRLSLLRCLIKMGKPAEAHTLVKEIKKLKLTPSQLKTLGFMEKALGQI